MIAKYGKIVLQLLALDSAATLLMIEMLYVEISDGSHLRWSKHVLIVVWFVIFWIGAQVVFILRFIAWKNLAEAEEKIAELLADADAKRKMREGQEPQN